MLWFAIFLALLYIPKNDGSEVSANHPRSNMQHRRTRHSYLRSFTAYIIDSREASEPKPNPISTTGSPSKPKSKPRHRKQKHKKKHLHSTSLHKPTLKPKSATAELYVRPHLVRDDAKLKDYAVHLYERTIKIFDKIRKISDNKTLIDFVADGYKRKYMEYFNITQNEKIKTKLGDQKVIINLLDTSNLILRRCFDYLLRHTEDEVILRADEYGIANVAKREMQFTMDKEYKYVCEKFNICRARYGFLDFVTELIDEVLKNSNQKLRKVADSLTESMRNTKFKKALDVDLQHKYILAIERVEKWSDLRIVMTLNILRNMINMRNQPFQVPSFMNNEQMDKVVAFMDMLNTMHHALPPNEENVREWKNIKEALQLYTEGIRHDIQKVTNAFVEHIMNRALNQLPEDTALKLKNQLRIVLS